MRFKPDENVTTEAADVLRRLGHDVDTVVAEGLQGANDQTVRETASRAARMVVTFDVGFAGAREGRGSGVPLLRLADQQHANVVLVLTQLATIHDLDSFAGCVVVVSERLVRVRRPDIA